MELRGLLEANGLMPQPALVGFSGGADSTALLLLLREAGWTQLHAVHFNHHLRGEAADGDQRWCEEFCRRRGIDFEAIDLFVHEEMRRGESVESAARRCRIDAWRRLIGHSEGKWRVLFLGHHADDRLEELFLRLGRGANATGLTSLRIRREVDGGRLVVCRPLLEFRKTQLEEYLRQSGITDWRVDATNLDDCCRRNAIRNRLLPMIREIFGTDAGFRQSLRVLTDDAKCLEGAAERAMQAGSGGQGDDIAFLRTLEQPVLQRLLRLKWPSVAFSAESVERLHAAMQRDCPEGLRLPVGCGQMLCFRNGRMVLESASQRDVLDAPVVVRSWRWREEPCVTWCGGGKHTWRLEARMLPEGMPLRREPLADGCWREYFSADALPEVLAIRCWQAGDRIRPFGARGHHRKLQDVFSDAHIRGAERLGYPLLLAGEEIIWVPSLVRAEVGRAGGGSTGAVLCFVAKKVTIQKCASAPLRRDWCPILAQRS